MIGILGPLEVVDWTRVVRLCFLRLPLQLQNGLIVFLRLPQQLDVLASPLRQKLGFFIISIFVIIDDHLHHLLLGAVEHEYIWVRDLLANCQQRMDFIDFVAEGE